MPEALAILGTAAAGLFAGSALYITAIEHPAALSAGKEVYWPYVRKALPRAAKMQGVLAAAGGLTAVGYALSPSCGSSHFSRKVWATAGGLMLANWPYSVIQIFPINARLLGDAEVPEEEKEALYRAWGRSHAVRTALGVASFGIMLFGLIHLKKGRPAK